MRNLYKLIGAEPTSTADEIRRCLEENGRPESPEAFVLGDEERRRVYDRNHRVLAVIGELRVNLGLTSDGFAEQDSVSGFSPDRATRPSFLAGESKRRPAGQPRLKLYRWGALALIMIIILTGLGLGMLGTREGDRAQINWIAPQGGRSFYVKMIPLTRNPAAGTETALLDPGATVTMNVPPGEYVVQLGWGRHWDPQHKFGKGPETGYYEVGGTYGFPARSAWKFDLASVMMKADKWRALSAEEF